MKKKKGTAKAPPKKAFGSATGYAMPIKKAIPNTKGGKK